MLVFAEFPEQQITLTVITACGDVLKTECVITD